MKKIILSALSVVAIVSIVFISCKSKNDNSAITPTYKDEATSTGGNPNTTNVTTTGTIATTSSANQNSTMSSIGQTGVWLSPNCGTVTPLCLTSNNSSTGTTVSICFTSPPVAGSYALVSSSAANGPNKAFMTITNPTGQPTNSTWFSSGGTVTVVVGTGVTATFSNVQCFQSGSFFPAVTASGQVGCN